MQNKELINKLVVQYKLGEHDSQAISNLFDAIFTKASQCQITPIIMDLVPVLDLSTYRTLEQKLSAIFGFGKLISFIDSLGSIEHSNDWDPYLCLVFNDLSEIETESGYYSFEVEDENLLLHDSPDLIESDIPGEGLYHTIPIQSIAYIKLMR